MDFYQQQLIKIKGACFPNEDLCRQVMRGKQFIDKNYANSIGLREIAGESCISKFHFIRLFKKYYGLTPHRYLTEVRIAAAKKMLLSGVPVADTCYAVGFDSPTSFAGLFKKITGAPPYLFLSKKAILKSPVWPAFLNFAVIDPL